MAIPASHAGGRRLLGALAALLLLGAGAAAPAAARGAAFGDSIVYRQCLKFTAVAYSDRQEAVDNHDWVTLRVVNDCRAPLRNLLIELDLVDIQGRVYGDQIWLLGDGELLLPRATLLERYSIPDPEQRVAVSWGVRILNLETNAARPSPRRVRVAAKPAPAKAPFCLLGFCF